MMQQGQVFELNPSRGDGRIEPRVTANMWLSPPREQPSDTPPPG